MQQWQFSPATIDGKPVAVKVNIETNFRLSTSPSDPGYPLHTPGPEYSLSLIERKLQGIVQLDARVGKDGHMKEVSVVSGDAELAKATKKTVEKWFYQPFLADGKPVEQHLLITANFTLFRHPSRGQPIAAVKLSAQMLP